MRGPTRSARTNRRSQVNHFFNCFPLAYKDPPAVQGPTGEARWTLVFVNCFPLAYKDPPAVQGPTGEAFIVTWYDPCLAGGSLHTNEKQFKKTTKFHCWWVLVYQSSVHLASPVGPCTAGGSLYAIGNQLKKLGFTWLRLLVLALRVGPCMLNGNN